LDGRRHTFAAPGPKRGQRRNNTTIRRDGLAWNHNGRMRRDQHIQPPASSLASDGMQGCGRLQPEGRWLCNRCRHPPPRRKCNRTCSSSGCCHRSKHADPGRTPRSESQGSVPARGASVSTAAQSSESARLWPSHIPSCLDPTATPRCSSRTYHTDGCVALCRCFPPFATSTAGMPGCGSW